LFGALKSRGFNLEDTHLKEPERLTRLLALLAIAFTWQGKRVINSPKLVVEVDFVMFEKCQWSRRS